MNEKNSGPVIAVAIIGLALLGLFNDGTETTGSFLRSSISKNVPSPQQTTTTGETIGEIKNDSLSGYYNLVKIQNGFNLGSQDPRNEYITLAASSKLNSAINISSWTLHSSATEKSVSLGRATLLYYAGNLKDDSNIVIGPNTEVIVATGQSPVGASFRVNICSGYLNQFNTFTPTLSYSCPLAKNEDLSSVPPTPRNDNCLDYIDRISACQIPTRPLTPEFSSECFLFIQEVVNYQGCVDIHRHDASFYKNEWRIFLGRNESLWKNRREKIELLDESGKLVSVYEKK